LIHDNSARKSAKMLCINCAGLPAELIESELFGSIRGAFTGSADRMGLIQHAANSTLFLDELSEMPLGLQSKLLRFLQDRQVRRVGSVSSETVNVRVIAAINKEPRLCISEKNLREDLYYRLSTITIAVPLLRDRPQDIMPLACVYLKYFSEQFNRKPPTFSAKIEKALLAYHWPGNVRQLQNEMTRCALLCDDIINLEDLSIQHELTRCEREALTLEALQKVANTDVTIFSSIERAELKIIVDVLMACNFNKQQARIMLGIGRQTLYNKIRKYGIKLPNDCRLTDEILPIAAIETPHLRRSL